MRKLLVALLFSLAPYKAYCLELIIPFSFGGDKPAIESPTIIDMAMHYNGLDANKNREELKEILMIDPVHVPWCAGFINFVLNKTGYVSTNNLLASSYHFYGIKVNDPTQGDIVLLKRNGGSGRHVAFFYGYHFENGVEYVLLLGGNQDNMVNIKAYPLQQVVEYRRPIRKYS